MQKDAKERFVREMAVKALKSCGLSGKEADARPLDDEAVERFERAPSASDWMNRIKSTKAKSP